MPTYLYKNGRGYRRTFQESKSVLLPLRVIHLKTSSAGAFVVPSIVLSRKPLTGDNVLTLYLVPLTTVFVDKRLWKTKHSRKRFQNFR